MGEKLRYEVRDKLSLSSSIEQFLISVWREYFNNDAQEVFQPFSYQVGFFTELFRVMGQYLLACQGKDESLFGERGLYSVEKRESIRINERNCKAWEEARGNKVFHNLRVLCLGGLEGRVLAALGAQVVNVDPLIAKLPESKLPSNLIEIPRRFPIKDDVWADVLKGGFDLTFSFWLFDRGSGLDSRERPMSYQIKPEELDVYKSVFIEALRVTKPGGLSVHSGNMMHLILNARDNNLNNLVGKVDVFADGFGQERPSDSLWIIKKSTPAFSIERI